MAGGAIINALKWMVDKLKSLTIFTPTYNREKLLPRLYESLTRQTSDDFVWLVVDDCSTDDTVSLINSYISEGKIDIKLIVRPKNGGKMRAHNDGTKACDTPYFLCLDSDDYLVDTAVEDLLACASQITPVGSNSEASAEDTLETSVEDTLEASAGEGNQVNAKIAGIIAHKGKSETELLTGVEFPEGIEKSTLYGLYLNGFKGETTIMFVTDIIRAYPFPEIEGEKYVPEDYIYDKIDKMCEYIILNKIITVCEIVEAGYTDSVVKLKQNNPTAFYLLYEQRAIITPLSVLKVKYAGFYVKYAKKCGRNIFDTKLNKLFVVIGALASVFINE